MEQKEVISEELLRGRMLNIEIGARIQIQAGGRGDSIKLNGVLIGFSLQEFLAIAIPAVPGVLAKLHEGARVAVRYIYGGGVYGFTSSVLNFIHKPKLIVFISYPRAIEVIHLRKAKRLISLLPASVEMERLTFEGVLIDLSGSGCRLTMEASQESIPIISPGDVLAITLQLGGPTRVQVLRGTVQTVKNDGKFAEMGVKFTEDQTESKIHIDNYLKSISALQERIPSISRPLG